MAKWGAGSFSAWLRTGLREVRQAIYPDSNIASQPEYGMYGTKTPGEVAEDRRGTARALDDESPKGHSVLAGKLLQAKSRNDRDDRSEGRDRER